MTKILVIEDEPDIRDSLEQVLKFEGYEVIIANNGKIGVNMAKELKPDLIICDVNMPELDGFGVLTEIRKDKSVGVTPFIFLTARADRKDLREGMNLGADDYLNKPFTIEELRKSIETRLAKVNIVKETADEKLEELRTNISMSLPHELKTPLNAIMGFAEVLSNEINSLEKDEIIQVSKMILEDARRLNRTIEKYLLFAHLQFLNQNLDKLGHIRYLTSEIDEDFIEAIFDTKLSLTGRKNDLVLHIEPAIIKINEDYLIIVIEQVGFNCFDYSDPGSQVIITGIAKDNKYTLMFSDHGRGMTEKQIAAIGGFMQFDRNIYEQQGTGMGLVISKKIANIFEADFSITSEPQQGTTVKISFPLVRK